MEVPHRTELGAVQNVGRLSQPSDVRTLQCNDMSSDENRFSHHLDNRVVHCTAS